MQATEQTFEQAAESLLIMPEAETEEATQVIAPEPEEAPETVEAETAVDETEAPEGETAEEATEEETEAPQPKTFTVKVDGKEVAVTEDELLRSYSGQAYIQKGMQEAATAKKEATAIYEALQAEQAKFVEIVTQIQSQGFKAAPTPPDADMAKSDPIGYLQADAEYRRDAAVYQQQQQQIQYVTQQQAELQKAALQEYLGQQKQLLAEKIPEYAVPVKSKALQEKIRKIGGEVYGFTDQELGGVVDARHVQVLHDAMKWRELQSGKVQPKQAEPPKVLKPQAKLPQPAQLVRAKQLETARKSGDLRAYAEAALLVPQNR